MSTLTLEEAQAQRVVIGLKDVAGPKGVRRDIDDLLLNDADAFNVFALAFSDLQKEEESSNYMSYFQLSGSCTSSKAIAKVDTFRYSWYAKVALGRCQHRNEEQEQHQQQWILCPWYAEFWAMASPVSSFVGSTCSASRLA
jgi:hypothetical protein